MCSTDVLLLLRRWLQTNTQRVLHFVLWGLLAEVLSQVIWPHVRKAIFLYIPWPDDLLPTQFAGSGAELLAINLLGVTLSGFVTALEMLPGVGNPSAALQKKISYIDDMDAEAGDPEESDSLLEEQSSTARSEYVTPEFAVCSDTAEAFKRGFVPVWTSYLAVVEHIADLLVRGEWVAATHDFLVTFAGGPAVFALAVRVGQRILGQTSWARSSFATVNKLQSDPEGSLFCVKAMLGASVFVFSAGGLLTESSLILADRPLEEELQHEFARKQSKLGAAPNVGRASSWEVGASSLWWELPWGISGVMVALLAGDLVATMIEGRQPLQQWFPGVHWPTAAQNAVALAFGHVLYLAESLMVSPASLARLKKAHQTAGGTLSAYSGFAERVGLAALQGDWTHVVSNLAVHAFLAAVGVFLVLAT